MSAGAISGSGTSLTRASGGFGALTSTDFIKVMMSELKNQDPLQPQDSSKLLEQFSSLRNIESQLNLQQSIQSLVLQNQISAAGNLINKTVTGIDDNHDKISGVVTAVRVESGKVLLDLDSGKSLSMGQVTQIAAPAGSSAAASANPASSASDSALLSALLPLLVANKGTAANTTAPALTPVMGPTQ